MDSTRYTLIRERLVALYRIITEKTYPVYIARSQLMTLEHLKRLQKADPIGGMDRYKEITERPLTIERLSQAFEIMGEELDLDFAKPHRDCVEVYNTIQEYNRLWVEIMTDFSWLPAVNIKELEYLEGISRHVFSWYREKMLIDRQLAFTGGRPLSEVTLTDILRGTMVHGSGQDDVSFVSYVDIYKSATNQYGAFGDTYSRPIEPQSIHDFLGGYDKQFNAISGLGG